MDPVTGKQKTQSAGTPNESEAIKAAGKWEDELRSGRYQAPNKTTWAEFRRRYTTENLNSLAPKTRETAETSLNHVERTNDTRDNQFQSYRTPAAAITSGSGGWKLLVWPRRRPAVVDSVGRGGR